MKKKPRILIISTRDKQGGAARAAYRLHQSLLGIGIDSYMLVLSKVSNDDRVIAPETKRDMILAKLMPSINNLFIEIISRKKDRRVFSASYSMYSVYSKIEKIAPDIVNLHWVGDGFLSMSELRKINVPIVWTLHDMWAFTGGCHYVMECKNYMAKCGYCEALESKKEKDLSRRLFMDKQKTYANRNITVVPLSQWLAKCAKQSSLFSDKEIRVIPNPIDQTVYKPLEKLAARRLLNLPIGKKLVFFGAMKQSSPIKGFEKLAQAIRKLPADQFELVVLGASESQKAFEESHKVHYLGQLSDDISLVAAYSAADVMVVPSLYENLSNVIMESLACGTPVTAFEIGGNSDMIIHRENGYLAHPYDTDDLAFGINWVTEDKWRQDKLSQTARESVIKKYNPKIVAESYLSLFEEKLNIHRKISLAGDGIH